MSRSSTAPGLGTVYATVFLDLFGFGILLPALPYYAQRLGATGLWLGVLFTAYSAAQLFGAAVLGRFSDRLGRRPVLLLSLAGSTASFALSAFATTLPGLAGARALAGLFGGSISTAQAYIADVTAPAERARAMGRLGASIGAGFVAGPAVGALVAAAGHGFRTSALLAAGLAAVNLAVAARRLVEPERRRDPRRPRLAGLATALRRPVIGAVLVATFLVMFGFVAMETTLAFLAERRFGTDERGLGMILVFVGLVLIAFQAALIGPLSRRFGERRVAVAGCLTIAATLTVLPFAPTLPLAYLVLGGVAAGQALASPALATLLSRATGADEQGTILGLGQSLSAGARAIGPLAAGLLYDLALPAPYLVGGAFAVVAAMAVAARGSAAASPTAPRSAGG